MSDDQDAIKAVLADFTPLGDDHPRAVETMDAVREMLEARAESQTSELTGELVQVDDSRVIRPGDTVILSTKHPLTEGQVLALKEQIVEQMPGIIPVIFDGVRIEGVFRADS